MGREGGKTRRGRKGWRVKRKNRRYFIFLKEISRLTSLLPTLKKHMK